jgi:hypothetical protein
MWLLVGQLICIHLLIVSNFLKGTIRVEKEVHF